MTNKAIAKDYDVIRHPVLTEKATKILEVANAYVFVVDISATKQEICRSIERIFDVKVEAVNTMVVAGKRKIFKGRQGKRASYKKAIVRLSSDSKIDLGVGR